MQVPEGKKVSVVGENRGFSERTRAQRQEISATRGRKVLRVERQRLFTAPTILTHQNIESRFGWILLSADAALFDFVEQGLVADAELLRSATAVPVHLT